MKLSKTKFIHYMNSKHRTKFLESYQRLVDNQTFNDDNLFELIELEKNAKKQILISSVLESYDEDTLDIDAVDPEELKISDPQLEVMMPYYEKIEALSERKIKNQFGGHVTYSKDTFSQKYFQVEKDGYYFFAFLDAYQEDDSKIRIIETKATTSKKFINLEYKDDDGNKYSIFAKSPEGILRLRGELGLSVNQHYHKKVQKLFDRESKEGKYVYDLAYQRYVVMQADAKEKLHEYYLSILNTEYIFDGKYDSLGEAIYRDEIMVFIDLTKVTEAYMEQMEDDFTSVIFKLEHMDEEAIKLEEALLKVGNAVKVKYEELIGIDNPITDYHLSHHGFRVSKEEKYLVEDLIKMNKKTVLDVPYEWLHRKNYQIQYDAVKNQELYLDKERIKAAIKNLKYPIYHLDFETFPCPLPRYKGEKPYSQSVFQFSLHVEHKPGVCNKDKDHFEFLAPDHTDYRSEISRLLTTLIKDDEGDVMAYNYGFEKGRMKELASFFPEYSNELLKIVDRTYDLIHIIRGNEKLFHMLGFGKESKFNFYHPNMHGSYSIKKVLPVLSDLTYKGMPIGNGTQALVTYAKFPEMKKENHALFKKNYEDLLAYCKQDTWAMYVVLEALRKLVDI